MSFFSSHGFGITTRPLLLLPCTVFRVCYVITLQVTGVILSPQAKMFHAENLVLQHFLCPPPAERLHASKTLTLSAACKTKLDVSFMQNATSTCFLIHNNCVMNQTLDKHAQRNRILSMQVPLPFYHLMRNPHNKTHPPPSVRKHTATRAK